jgi:C-terminal processing protease CtpA/Prc
MDAYSASTSAEFLALAQKNQIGILVGEESGGAAAGGNGSSFIEYTLPKSGIFVHTPLVYYQNAISKPSKPGRGVMPDHLIQMQAGDLMINKDRVLDFVFDLIQRNRKP